MTGQSTNGPGPSTPGPRHIVVGIDGSPAARGALEWAVNRLRPGDSLEIINVWHQNPSPGAISVSVDPTFLAEAAQGILDRELAVLKSTCGELADVTTRAVEGHPGAALIDAARDSNLLVIGSRGHGGFKDLLLGSTSTYLAHHARFPLAIIPWDRHHPR